MKRSAALAIVLTSGHTGADMDPVRPRTRADCIDGPRPCAWVSCRHHLALTINTWGRVAIEGGNELPEDPTDADLEAFADAAIARALRVGSCVLDRVEHRPDGETLNSIATVLALTRERIRQIETKALRPLGPRIRRKLGRVLEASTPDPTGAAAMAKASR